MDIVFDLSRCIVGTSFEDLNPNTVDVTKRFILDTLGVGIAGSAAAGAKEAAEQMLEWGGKPESTIICFGKKVPSLNAAFANSVMIHARDFDDTHDGAVVHANVTVLPTVMAMAETMGGIAGKDFLCALVLGIDLSCRLGLAITNAPEFAQHEIRWVRTAVCGIFGAAAAACKILGLGEEEIVNAMGIALSQIGGTRQVVVDSALTKRIQPAFMTSAGITSALLAKRGVTGCTHVFEGDYGYFNLYWGGRYARSELTEGLGEKFQVDNLSFKPYPCCRYNHGAIDATLRCAQRNGISSDAVEEVTVHLVKHAFFELVSRPFELRGNPSVDAQFSLPYTVASGLLDGYVFLDSFEPEKVKERAKSPLLKRVIGLRDEAIRDPASLGPVTVEIKTKAGKIFSETVEEFKGHPKNTMTEEECRDKFLRCSGYSVKPFSRRTLDQIVETVLRMETLSNTNDITGLLK
jgi:2-methylcitrate dehydratase PrpD